jgi:hypothetical protein
MPATLPLHGDGTQTRASSEAQFDYALPCFQWQYIAADRIKQADGETSAAAGDHLQFSEFYVAADMWTCKSEKEWGLGKTFGAFFQRQVNL